MSDNKKAFIFFGLAGSGKGTQVQLLKDYVAKTDSREILHYEAGGGFREFMSENDTFVSKLMYQTIMVKGEHCPRFLPIWNWARRFVYEMKEDMNLIMDGSPRQIQEMEILNPAFPYMGYEDINVIYINVPKDVVTKRLLERGRGDDQEEKIKHRLEWFEKEIVPVLDFYKNDPKYKFVEVNGDQTVEDVHKEVISKLGF